MNPSNVKPSKVVFVSNIPFDQTEEQLIGVFEEVGPVASFKLVFDRETNKPKGFGFCEFYDVGTASSAVRNLHNYDLEGRPLRVMFADPMMSGMHTTGEGSMASLSGSHVENRSRSGSRGRMASPAVVKPILSFNQIVSSDPNINNTEGISRTLASMTQTQLYELLAHVKHLTATSPDQMQRYLSDNPQLTYAILQTMLMLHLIDETAAREIMQSPTAPGPVGGPGYPTFAPNSPLVDNSILQQQQAALMELLRLTPQQLELLPQEQRQQVIQLKSQLAAAQGQLQMPPMP
ncbi:hypothetical protein IWQ62_003022 [Dispira parvispora]|uniref:RRM domain-containing protein n=1 Tax=Dispira parvispora TaxID=1520584 RepID=A0A9W8AUY0_9FUNG|nr:hypothetical protein IWQ62_003022 [Dispira parvispora]